MNEMLNRIWGYTRGKECLDKQKERLKEYNKEICVIEEEESIMDADVLTQYYFLKQCKISKGDQLVITSLDKLGRNKEEVKSELEFFKKMGIIVRILDLPTTLIETPKGHEYLLNIMNNLLIEVLGTMAEKEREDIKVRKMEERAKGEKNTLGRPRVIYPTNWEEVYLKLIRNEITAVKAMQLLDLKKSTFYKLVKEYKEINTCSKICL